MYVRSVTGFNCKEVYSEPMTTNRLAGIPTRKTKDESIIAHFSDGELLVFKRDEIIIDENNSPEGVYLIKEGFVKAYSVSQTGQGNLLLIHEAGEFIPLPWALDGTRKTGLFYEAISDVTIIRDSKDKLRTAMGRNPWLSAEVFKQAVNIIIVYTQRIQTLEFRSARGRIIAELLALSERFGEKRGKKVLINAPITHQDIADSINMNRETASRALGLLFEEGLMSQDDHLLTILDLPKLQAALK